jgi:hypothetical protein
VLITLSSPWPGGLASDGVTRTQEPQWSRERLSLGSLPFSSGGPGTFYPISGNGDHWPEHADNDEPLTGSRVLREYICTIFGCRALGGVLDRKTSDHRVGVIVTVAELFGGLPGPDRRISSNDLHRFWESSDVSHAVHIQSIRGSSA